MKKREFLAAGATGLMSLVPEAVRAGAWAAGSAHRLLVMASVMQFDEKYGLKITPSKEARLRAA